MQFSGFWEPVELGRGFIVFCLSLHSLLRHWRESCECPPPPSTEGNGGEANHHLIMKFNKLDLKGILILLSFGQFIFPLDTNKHIFKIFSHLLLYVTFGVWCYCSGMLVKKKNCFQPRSHSNVVNLQHNIVVLIQFLFFLFLMCCCATAVRNNNQWQAICENIYAPRLIVFAKCEPYHFQKTANYHDPGSVASAKVEHNRASVWSKCVLLGIHKCCLPIISQECGVIYAACEQELKKRDNWLTWQTSLHPLPVLKYWAASQWSLIVPVQAPSVD